MFSEDKKKKIMTVRSEERRAAERAVYVGRCSAEREPREQTAFPSSGDRVLVGRAKAHITLGLAASQAGEASRRLAEEHLCLQGCARRQVS